MLLVTSHYSTQFYINQVFCPAQHAPIVVQQLAVCGNMTGSAQVLFLLKKSA